MTRVLLVLTVLLALQSKMGGQEPPQLPAHVEPTSSHIESSKRDESVIDKGAESAVQIIESLIFLAVSAPAVIKIYQRLRMIKQHKGRLFGPHLEPWTVGLAIGFMLVALSLVVPGMLPARSLGKLSYVVCHCRYVLREAIHELRRLL